MGFVCYNSQFPGFFFFLFFQNAKWTLLAVYETATKQTPTLDAPCPLTLKATCASASQKDARRKSASRFEHPRDQAGQ
jgi:hypothetical protein